jgi:glycine/D-amino acid oxidase-like deaminating enzyme
VQSDSILLCAGQWTRQIAATVGACVPLHSAEHFYIITQPIAGVHPNLPILRDLDALVYYREWGQGLCMGGFEQEAKPVFTEGVPNDFAFGLFPDDWEHFSVRLIH